MEFLVKIAAELKHAVDLRVASGFDSPPLRSRVIACGAAWSVDDVLCACGPHDRPFKEQHSRYSVALVLAGSFQYGAAVGNHRDGKLMTPGTLLLGNPGGCFECSHEHGHGDRCLSFHFSPEYFEMITSEAGLNRSECVFPVLRLPALREFSGLAARASAAMAASFSLCDRAESHAAWNEIAVEIAVASARLASHGTCSLPDPPPSTIARISRTVRLIEDNYELDWPLERLAREARLSQWHFLRSFEHVTGLTPHQYIRRIRLRNAGAQLLVDSSHVLDIAMGSGFGDLSNFNRAFKSEFGVTPRRFRRPEKAKPAAD